MQRRRLLSTVAASTGMIAGCSSRGGVERPDVSVEAAVVSQPTEDRPPTITFRFTNKGGKEITASANNKEPFVYFPRLDGPRGSAVLLPGVRGIGSDAADSPTDGCWRFVSATGEEAILWMNDDIERLTLGSGLYHDVQHRVFYEGDENSCFPDGTYSEAHQVEFHDTESTMTYTVRLSFSDGRISGLEVQQ